MSCTTLRFAGSAWVVLSNSQTARIVSVKPARKRNANPPSALSFLLHLTSALQQNGRLFFQPVSGVGLQTKWYPPGKIGETLAQGGTLAHCLTLVSAGMSAKRAGTCRSLQVSWPGPPRATLMLLVNPTQPRRRAVVCSRSGRASPDKTGSSENRGSAVIH